MDINEKKEYREKYLKLVYDKTNGMTNEPVDMDHIGQELNLDPINTANIVQYLVDKGYLKHFALGGEIAITIAGIDYVENLPS